MCQPFTYRYVVRSWGKRLLTNCTGCPAAQRPPAAGSLQRWLVRQSRGDSIVQATFVGRRWTGQLNS